MKKFLTWVCLAVFLLVGINAAVTMASLPRTYDGNVCSVIYISLHIIDPSEFSYYIITVLIRHVNSKFLTLHT